MSTQQKAQIKQQLQQKEGQAANQQQAGQKLKKVKVKPVKEDQKANTNAWQLKQQQKKKQKQQAQENSVNDKKQKKQKKKPKQDKTQIPAKQEKAQQVLKQPQQGQQIQTVPKPKLYDPLITISNENSIAYLIGDKRSQQQIMFNNMAQFVSSSDTILYLGKGKWNPNCEKVSISGFAECESAELICKYKDVCYFFEGEITKLFCQALVVFDNGSALVKKGSLSLVLMAQQAKVQVVVNTCSWNYSGYKPLNEDDLERKYGQNIFENYDWIPSKWTDLIVMEVGGMQASQVGTQIGHRYKTFAIDKIKW